MSDTPRTDEELSRRESCGQKHSLQDEGWASFCRELERENAELLADMVTHENALSAALDREDELRGKLAQVHKDLGCELMDPNGTIWQHAAKVQEENKELLARLAGMEEAQRDMILHGVLRNELAVILGMPAQERTRDGNNKLLMTLVDQLDAVHLMLRKATNENASLAAKLAGMEEEKARLKFYEYTNTKN